MIDRERLETALDCLLENAVHFTRDGDRIAVTGRRAADGWIVEVTDSGAGMTAEEVSALNTNTYPIRRTASGSGLGLRIVRAAVGAAGGRVCLSAEPGAGTTVTLHFPGDAADAALGAPELDGAIGPDGWHMRDDKSMTAP
jgi:signal transduction histidine kinase